MRADLHRAGAQLNMPCHLSLEPNEEKGVQRRKTQYDQKAQNQPEPFRTKQALEQFFILPKKDLNAAGDLSCLAIICRFPE
jgi:hypothetical protein